jgi:hypothetical protein
MAQFATLENEKTWVGLQNSILIVFGDGLSAGRSMKYHPQTSFGGIFCSIPTEKNSSALNLKMGQSPRESPFTDEIDIPGNYI